MPTCLVLFLTLILALHFPPVLSQDTPGTPEVLSLRSFMGI